VTSEFQRHGDRRGAAWGEQNLVEVVRRGLNQAPRQRRRGRIGETAWAEGKGFHLVTDCGDDLWVAVAELMDAVAVKVEDAPAVDVGQDRAFGAHDRRETGRGKRLTEEKNLALAARRLFFFRDAGLRVIDLDYAPGGPNLEVEERLVKHERRRPSVGCVAGADETVRLEPLRRRDRQDLGHDLARVACRRADLDAVAPELRDDIRR